MGLAAIVVGVLGLRFAVTGSQVTLAWDPSPSANIAGYRLYQGNSSRTYNAMLDVGNTNAATSAGLLAGTTYFFAVTAYDTLGLESTFSDEVSYTVPTNSPPALQLQISGSQDLLLTGIGTPGSTYEVQTSADLQNWSPIGVLAVNLAGTLNFTVPGVTNSPIAFFRLRQLAP